jgi:beta-1,4-mannosyltransferase
VHSPVRVQLFSRPPGTSLRYVDQVVGEGSPTVEYTFGNTRPNPSIDVIHLPRFEALHGPDAPTGRPLLRSVIGFVLRLLRHRVALVRTLHGVDRRRSRGRSERLATWILDRATTAFVVVEDSAPLPRSGRTTVIGLGTFRDRFVGYPRSEQTPGRLLFLAPVQLGGGVQPVLRAFPDATSPSLSLRVLGPAPAPLVEQVTQLTREHPAISACLEHVSTGTVIKEMTASEMVILPGVERLEELTVLTTALSLQRPVLVPDSPTAQPSSASTKASGRTAPGRRGPRRGRPA